MTTNQFLGLFILIGCAVLGAVAFLCFRVGRIARGPVPVGPQSANESGVLEATRRWQAGAAGVHPSYLPPKPTGSGRHAVARRVPPEGETRPVTVGPVPDPADMTAVDAMFRDRFADRREPLVEPTQRVSVIGWNDTPPSPPPAPSFADYITGKNEELRARLNDPDRTGLLPPVTSRRGAA